MKRGLVTRSTEAMRAAYRDVEKKIRCNPMNYLAAEMHARGFESGWRAALKWIDTHEAKP